MTDSCLSIDQMLAEARIALHRLQIGTRVVRIRLSDGSESEFTPAKINELKGYVEQLEREAAGLMRHQRGAIGIIF
jgi:hypothetical protein